MTIMPKLRTFNEEEAELWFFNADFQFANCIPKITNSMTKFQHACMSLSPEIQRHVKDLFQMPPEDPYAALKERLCKVFAPSPADIAARVLDAPQLGDSSAIGLVASMLQHLPRSEHESHVVRESFLRRLPLDIRRIVEIDETFDIRKLATKADKLLKSRVHPPISVTGTQVQVVTTMGARTKQLSTQQSFKKKGPKTWCWLHRKFGKEARNCIGQCEWPNYPVATVGEIQENY